jgi:hypothetical protein
MQNEIYHRLEEFKELIWDDYISENLISNSYIEKNSEFISEVTFDLFRMHQKTNGALSIQVAARTLESFLLNSFRYKPDQEDIVSENY